MAGKEVSLFERPLLSFARSTRQRMAIVSAGAGLAVAQPALAGEGAPLILAAFCVAGALSAECLVAALKKQRLINDLSALASGLIFTLTLPAAINPVFAFLGAFFAISVVKGAFGGLGSNWLNPALAAWLFVRFTWPAQYTAALAASPMEAQGFLSDYGIPPGFWAAGAAGALEWLNKTLFALFSAEVPSGFALFLFNAKAGLAADRGVFALILASVLISASIHRFLLSALYLSAYLFLVRLGGAPDGGVGQGDMFYCLFSGGTLVAAFFLIADPATGAKSLFGKIVYVSLAACLSFVFRYGRGDLCGAFFAVIMLNTLCPVIRGIESRRVYQSERSVSAERSAAFKGAPGGGRL